MSIAVLQRLFGLLIAAAIVYVIYWFNSLPQGAPDPWFQRYCKDNVDHNCIEPNEIGGSQKGVPGSYRQ